MSAQDNVLCAIGARFDFGRVSGRMLTRFFREGRFVHGCKSVSKLAPLYGIRPGDAKQTPRQGKGKPGQGAWQRVLRQQVGRLI